VKTNYTACYHAVPVPNDALLQEECRILTGVSPCNLEIHDDTLNFTITVDVDDVDGDVSPEEYFDTICRDLNNSFKNSQFNLDEIFVDFTLDEIFVDD